MITPAFASPKARPASFQASRAAITPNNAAREYRFGSACESLPPVSPVSGWAAVMSRGGTGAATFRSTGQTQLARWSLAYCSKVRGA